jgi:hypothetical protein
MPSLALIIKAFISVLTSASELGYTRADGRDVTKSSATPEGTANTHNSIS